jgi:hypothetical protein
MPTSATIRFALLLPALFACLAVACSDTDDKQPQDQPQNQDQPRDQADVDTPAEEVDPIGSAVDQAEQRFRQELASAKQALNQLVKAEYELDMKRAAEASDLDTLEALQNELKAFEAEGKTPNNPSAKRHIQAYNQKRTELGDELVKAYETAVTQYTQAIDVENARLMQAKMRWTRPTVDLDTQEYEGHHYRLFRNRVPWHQAKADCEALGGYLVCFNNQAEHEFIVENVMEKTGVSAWVGGTDAKKEGQWVWLDGNVSNYWPWTRGEPNNGGRVPDNYAAINILGKLVDLHSMNTKRTNGYICEWDVEPTREILYDEKQ